MPLVKTRTAHEDALSQYGGQRVTRWPKPPSGQSVLEIQTTKNPTWFKDMPDDKNLLIPPYHWHWYQEEHFYVKEGRFVFTLEGKDFVVTPDDPQPLKISPRARHTFKADKTYDGQCTVTSLPFRMALSGADTDSQQVEIMTAVSPNADDPEETGMTEKFFRNLYQYLDDCYSQKVEPSLPQLLLMLDSAEVSLAFSWGPDWLMRAVSYSMGVVIGRWLGGYVLGYKAVYPEYYDSSMKESRKDK